MTLALSLCSRVINSVHCVTKRNISLKFNENLLKGSGEMEWTIKCYWWTDRLADEKTKKVSPIILSPIWDRGLTSYMEGTFTSDKQAKLLHRFNILYAHHKKVPKLHKLNWNQQFIIIKSCPKYFKRNHSNTYSISLGKKGSAFNIKMNL